MPEPQIRAYRFVVVYRGEPREIATAGEVWRGWIERIPDPRSQAAGVELEERLSFQDLGDLPRLIRRLMDRRDQATDQRRPGA